MIKKWAIPLVCATMAFSAAAGGMMFSLAGTEIAAEESGAIELLTEPLTSAQNPDRDWMQTVTIPLGEQTIEKGDVLSLTYTIDQERGPSMWVGETAMTGMAQLTTSGTWSYTFTDAYAGDITIGVWTSTFTVSSATLTKVPPALVYDELIFAGVTEEPAGGKYVMGTGDEAVTGEIKTDGTLSYGQFEDKTYYITATDVASTVRVDLPYVLNLRQAYLDDAILKFSAKFDFSSETERSAQIRIFYESGEWGVRGFSVTELIGTESFRAGEWAEYSVKLSSLSQICSQDTWGNALGKPFDWTKFRGVGFSVFSAPAENGHNVVSFGNVRLDGEVKDKKATGISLENPAKMEYEAGDAFDPAGMKVYALFADGSKVEVFDYVTEAPESLLPDSVVKVKWDGWEAIVPVTVQLGYAGLRIETAPVKTYYKAGEKFDPAGIVVKAVKPDGSEDSVEIGELTYTYAGEMLPEGVTEIVFSYKGLTVSQPVVVADYENAMVLFDSSVVDEDGDPRDGWNVNSIGNSVVSQTTYDAAAEADREKMRVIGTDEAEGKYFTAEASSWAVSRVFEVGVADFNLLELYNDPDYQGVVTIRYRTKTLSGSVSFGLANFFDWNLGFKKADITSYIQADGQWHTIYLDIALFYGDIDGMLWTDSAIVGNVDFTKIAGFAIACMQDSLDIASVEIKWNGSSSAAFRSDVTAPTVTYNGGMSFTLKEGDAAPDFSEATAFDNFDGDVEVVVQWSEGAITDGKVNAGSHSVVLYAVDAAGNKSSEYTVTVTAEAEIEPDDSSSGVVTDSSSGSDSAPSGSSGSDGAKPAAVGCGSSLGLFGGAALLVLSGALMALKGRKRE